jgi:hypothetical protein
MTVVKKPLSPANTYAMSGARKAVAKLPRTNSESTGRNSSPNLYVVLESLPASTFL